MDYNTFGYRHLEKCNNLLLVDRVSSHRSHPHEMVSHYRYEQMPQTDSVRCSQCVSVLDIRNSQVSHESLSEPWAQLSMQRWANQMWQHQLTLRTSHFIPSGRRPVKTSASKMLHSTFGNRKKEGKKSNRTKFVIQIVNLFIHRLLAVVAIRLRIKSTKLKFIRRTQHEITSWFKMRLHCHLEWTNWNEETEIWIACACGNLTLKNYEFTMKHHIFIRLLFIGVESTSFVNRIYCATMFMWE